MCDVWVVVLMLFDISLVFDWLIDCLFDCNIYLFYTYGYDDDGRDDDGDSGDDDSESN